MNGLIEKQSEDDYSENVTITSFHAYYTSFTAN